MKRAIIFSLAILTSAGLLAFSRSTVTADRNEAKKGLEYLNKIRQNPSAYSKEIGLDMSKFKKMPVLKWNDTLAKVAEAKAMDMAKRSYFGHIDPDGNGMNIKIHQAGYKLSGNLIENKSDNTFESISAGNDDIADAIQTLILDEGVNPPYHRQHLLGLDPFWADCYDIGIGFVRSPNSNYHTYTCILIAKHKM